MLVLVLVAMLVNVLCTAFRTLLSQPQSQSCFRACSWCLLLCICLRLSCSCVYAHFYYCFCSYAGSCVSLVLVSVVVVVPRRVRRRRSAPGFHYRNLYFIRLFMLCFFSCTYCLFVLLVDGACCYAYGCPYECSNACSCGCAVQSTATAFYTAPSKCRLYSCIFRVC